MREHHMVMALTYLMDKTGKIKEVFTYQALSYSVCHRIKKTWGTGTTERGEELQFIFSSPLFSQSGASVALADDLKQNPSQGGIYTMWINPQRHT